MAASIRKCSLNVIYVAVIIGTTMMNVIESTGWTDAPIFIFGDSTVDVGTNNDIENCSARADHPYYGIDYLHSKPTGRSSNGFNTADTIVQRLGGYTLSPPPFVTLIKNTATFKRKIRRGVNFGSGGAGIYYQTGQAAFGKVISLEEQIQQFATVRENITELLGPSEGDHLLQSSMYIISIGSNDIMTYIFTHFLPREQFIANITDSYGIHLQNLYKLGARKFGIISIPALGCCPLARAFTQGGDCDQESNNLAQDFHTSILSLLQNYSSTFEGFKYSLGNAYNMTMNIIDNPQGFKDVKIACCGNNTQRPAIPCQKGAHLCSNRDDYLFWDAFHPTQAASQLAARVLVYDEGSEFVSPMNFSSLRRA